MLALGGNQTALELAFCKVESSRDEKLVPLLAAGVAPRWEPLGDKASGYLRLDLKCFKDLSGGLGVSEGVSLEGVIVFVF